MKRYETKIKHIKKSNLKIKYHKFIKSGELVLPLCAMGLAIEPVISAKTRIVSKFKNKVMKNRDVI